MPKDDLSEQFVWVDDQDMVLGSVKRSVAHSDKSKIHRAVVVLVVNDAGDMLFQKRSMEKDLNPGKWTISCGGHVDVGETYQQAARRELEEELGLDLDLKEMKKILIHDSQETEYIQAYQAVYNDLPEFYDPDEISELGWVDKRDIDSFVASSKFAKPSRNVLVLLGIVSGEGV